MSFKLLYSGSSVYQGQQNLATESLGGYISDSLVPNNKSGNVFSAESYLGIINSIPNVRCVILQALSTHTNLLIGVLPEDEMTDSSDIQLGFAILGSNTSTEQLPDEQSFPSNTDMNDILYMQSLSDTDHMFEVEATIETGSYIAIWIARTLKNNYNQTLIDQIALDESDDSDVPILTGFRLVINVDGTTPPNPPFIYDDRIEYTSNSDGQTTFQNNALKNKEVSVIFRENQYLYINVDYSFDTITGTITWLQQTLDFGQRVVIFYQ